MHWAERAQLIYPKLPVALQNAVCSAYGITALRQRRGRFFRRKLQELLVSEHWSREQIEEYQDRELRISILRAYASVPYYRKLWDSWGLAPSSIKTRADLPQLPVLSKEQVRHHVKELLAQDADTKRLHLMHTSGTTGKSLLFYWAPEQAQFLWAIWWRHRLRFGLSLQDWHANFTGKLVIPPEQAQPPYWRCNWPLQQWLLNMHHITPDKIREIVHFLDQQRLVYYSGYPSILYALSVLALEQGLQLSHPPRYVVTGAENVLDHQREAIQQFTGARVIDQYGFSEGCANASQCPAGVYHEDFELGVLECAEPQVQPDGSVHGKVVCTGFANPWFPFIRYEVGDSALWAEPNYQCECGRQSRVLLRIEGRMDDYVITPEGRRIMRFDYLFKDTQCVREVQVVQHRLGQITLRVVRRQGYSAQDEVLLRAQVKRWISPRLEVQFEYLERIEREANGKFRAVRSFLPAS